MKYTVGILSKINFTFKNLILLVSNIYRIFHLMLESSTLEGWIPPENVICGSIYFQGKIEDLRKSLYIWKTIFLTLSKIK